MKKILICGATGFIGRNLVESYLEEDVQLTLVENQRSLPESITNRDNVTVLSGDLTRIEFVNQVVQGQDILIQAAATTSGSNVIVNQPYVHVTDNAVMNSLLFRACHDHKVKKVIFFSCTVMYPSNEQPVKETDFNHEITEKYFGVGWTKVYLEKMAEFYSNLGETQYTIIRHSNIYGPYDKYDLKNSHVFGASIAKVMNAKEKVVVWGEGTEARDLLHVDDLVRFVHMAIENQQDPFELLNIGSGTGVRIRDLVQMIISASGKSLDIEFDVSKPTIPFKLTVDTQKAKEKYDWVPRVSLEEGIQRSLEWYREHVQ